MLLFLEDAQTKVWRYMTFSRFVWLLQKKQLWLSHTDLSVIHGRFPLPAINLNT